MSLLHILCRPDMTSIDVGAKFGMYTYRLNKHSKKVVAFEPIKDLNTALSKIFKNDNIDVMPVALSDKSGEVSMRTPLYKSGNPCYGRSTIEKENSLEFNQIKGWNEFTIKTKRLDDLHINNIGFIKVDVEGHEQAVLEGAGKTIQKFRPRMLIEANNHHLPKAVEKLFSWAKHNDYLIYFMENNKIYPSSSYNIPDRHFQKNIENFILIHCRDTECLQNLKIF